MQSLRRIISATNDALNEAALGISTIGEETLSPERTPTSYRMIRRLVAALQPGPHDSFVDIGCGRGRVLCIAARYPVARVAGVEINATSAAAAKANLARLRGRRARDWSVTAGSALDYDYDGATILYFYNSVQGDLLRQLLERVRVTAGRPLRFVYVNPVCADIVAAATWLGPPVVLLNDTAGKPFALLYRSQ